MVVHFFAELAATRFRPFSHSAVALWHLTLDHALSTPYHMTPSLLLCWDRMPWHCQATTLVRFLPPACGLCHAPYFKPHPRDAHVNGRPLSFSKQSRPCVAVVTASPACFTSGTVNPSRGRGDPISVVGGLLPACLQTTFPRSLRGLALPWASAYYISQKKLRQPRPLMY